jgi:hypothetical protein
MLVYPFFEPTRLFSKKVLEWSLLLHFFRLSKREKIIELTFSGLVKNTLKGVSLCLANHIFISVSLA